jgi:hypothetical protein
MSVGEQSLPELEVLTEGLASVLAAGGVTGLPVTVVERREGASGSFPSELVVCRLGDRQEELKLHCKYSSQPDRHFLHGVRQGVAYEATVYRDLLRCVPLPVARFYGSYADAEGRTWLVLGHLDGAERIAKTDERNLPLAARWIGRFHALGEEIAAAGAPHAMPRYDADFYLGWMRRTQEFAAALPEHLPWLDRLAEGFSGVAERLLGAPATVIHGEFYPVNLVVANGVVYPVDWESAAVAAGEIDLVTLTEGWPDEIVKDCERAYCEARWLDGAPDGFESLVEHVRIYVAVRWLGDRSEWTVRAGGSFEELRELGERLGLL